MHMVILIMGIEQFSGKSNQIVVAKTFKLMQVANVLQFPFCVGNRLPGILGDFYDVRLDKGVSHCTWYIALGISPALV